MTRITAISSKASAGKENRFGRGPERLGHLLSDKQAGCGAAWFLLRRAGGVLLNCREEMPKPSAHTLTLSHAHLTLRLSPCYRPQRRQMKLGKVSTKKEEAPSSGTSCLLGTVTSLLVLLIHYSMFLIHYKLHLNFLAHVHLWDILILSSFFMYRASKKRISKCRILLRNELTAQFRVNFTAQWSERDRAANHTHLEGGLHRSLVLMGPVPCLQAK